MRWKASTKELQKYNPFNLANFSSALSRLNSYITCMRQCRHPWMGLKFHFLNLWMPHSAYKKGSKVSKLAEARFWMEMIMCRGFTLADAEPHDNYCLSNLHWRNHFPDSDSE